MSVWRVQPLAKRYLLGEQPVQPLDGLASPHPTSRAPADESAPMAGGTPRIGPSPETMRRQNTSIAAALAWLLGGYAIISALVAWMLANGDPQHEPLRALAPITLLISIFVAIGALGATVFGGRRYLVIAVGTLSLAVGVVVASAGALVTASF